MVAEAFCSGLRRNAEVLEALRRGDTRSALGERFATGKSFRRSIGISHAEPRSRRDLEALFEGCRLQQTLKAPKARQCSASRRENETVRNEQLR